MKRSLKNNYKKEINKKIAKFDINPFIIDESNRVLLGKRISNVQYGNSWHMPGEKFSLNERIPESLKRMTKLKTGVEIELYYNSLNDNVIGVYDDPFRDPREHVIGITFLCRFDSGRIRPGPSLF